MFLEMMMTMMIKYNAPGNPACRSLHTNFRLSKDGAQNFHFPLRERSEIYLAQLGEQGKALMYELNKIDGITEVNLSLYEVVIYFGPCFNAEDVSSKAIRAIQKIFDPELTAQIVDFPK